MTNNNQNFKSKMNTEFGSETDVNEDRQQIQQAEAKKHQASSSFANNNQITSSAMNVEFGSDTDVNEVRQRIQQAEAKKHQASGKFANNSYENENQ